MEFPDTEEIVSPPSGEEIRDDKELKETVVPPIRGKENPKVPQEVEVNIKEAETNKGKGVKPRL